MNRRQGKALASGPLETLFSGNATAKIIDFIISSQEWDYSESDIARNSGVSIRTVQREIPKLIKSKLIKQARTVGNAKMYQLDKSHKIGELMEKLALLLAQMNIHRMAALEVRMKGKETKKTSAIEEGLLSSHMKSLRSDELEEISA